MSLGGNESTGQVFTPNHVGKLMALLNLMDADEIIKENGYITAADPCTGAGVLLLTAATELRSKGYTPSTQALFYGQDIDETCVCMTYIQLTLTGCAAVVKHGDSLAEPCVDNLLFVKDDDSYWYTTMYYLPEWNTRRKEIIEAYKVRNAS
jgi:type I restriction-modification system DNA methylase subunit